MASVVSKYILCWLVILTCRRNDQPGVLAVRNWSIVLIVDGWQKPEEHSWQSMDNEDLKKTRGRPAQPISDIDTHDTPLPDFVTINYNL